MAQIDLARDVQHFVDVQPHEPIGVVAHWSSTASDPNDPTVIGDRARTLAAAWQPPITDRIAFISDRVAGKTVLDIGCVAHDQERMQSGRWLHAHVSDAAKKCVGVDILAGGVEAMRAAGYEAVVHDLSAGLGPLAQMGPFQVMVAGELIEHVSNLDMLFAAANEGLSADGELIITTPNPYAPARVRAGQRGDVWENVDHILYAFPSGIAELAERHGLVLAEAATTSPEARPSTGLVRWLKRSVKRSHWHRHGYATVGPRTRAIVLDRVDRLDRIRNSIASLSIVRRLGVRRRFVGETFVYVIARAPLE